MADPLDENENDQVEQLSSLASEIISCYQRLPDGCSERGNPEPSQAPLDSVEIMKQQEDNLTPDIRKNSTCDWVAYVLNRANQPGNSLDKHIQLQALRAS